MTLSTNSPPYFEITVADIPRAQRFYAAAFGWRFNDYGPEYAGIQSDDSEEVERGGLAGGGQGRPGGVLVLFESDDVDATARAVTAAGGVLDGEVYAYPGGRRFTFTDPDGNRLGVFQPSE